MTLGSGVDGLRDGEEFDYFARVYRLGNTPERRVPEKLPHDLVRDARRLRLGRFCSWQRQRGRSLPLGRWIQGARTATDRSDQ
jgi:hypothetical protein